MQTVALCFGRGISPGLRLPLRQRLAVHGILTAGVLGLLLYPASLWVIAAGILAALEGRWPSGPLAEMLLLLNVLECEVDLVVRAKCVRRAASLAFR